MKSFNQSNVKDVIMSSNIDQKYKEIILLRYGIDVDHVYTYEEIGKKFNLRGKKLHEEVEKAERLAFNILKTKSIYDIIIQN